jgi:hypothetical protein
METQNLIPKPKRKSYFCCFKSDSSDEDTIISIDKQSHIEIDPPVSSNPLTSYAADKVYLIGNTDSKFAVTFKHVIIEPKFLSTSRISYYTQNKSAAKISESDDSKIIENNVSEEKPRKYCISEKVAKKMSKMINNRIPLENCLISTQSANSLCVKMAKYCDVIVLEEESVITEMMKITPQAFDVMHKVNIIEGNILTLNTDVHTDLVALMLDSIGQDQSFLNLSVDFPDLLSKIQRSLQISPNLILIFPYSLKLDPKTLCEALQVLDIEPCIEFVLYFEDSLVKCLMAFIGPIARVSEAGILNLIIGKLGLGHKQKPLLNKIIKSISLQKTLKILCEAEKQSENKNTSKANNLKTKIFFDLTQAEECFSNDVIVLFKGPKGDSIEAMLHQLNEYYFEHETERESTLIVNGDSIVGEENIWAYLEQRKREERSNSNSLLNLIEP